ncbi:MAG: alpha/beta hydrolase fold domain-containing protein [Burkholderiales bacterium]
MLLPSGDFSNASIETASEIGRAFTKRFGVAVAVPAYTASGECPFPAAAEDAYSAAAWVQAQARARGWNPRLIVAGEEAGGNLAAATALMARDRGGPPLTAQILVSPMLDPSLTSGSMQAAPVADAAHSQARCAEAYRRYLPHAADRLHPYAAPLACRRLAGVAPALVLTATDDPLREEGASYASALIGAGVSTQVVRLPTLRSTQGVWTEAVWSAIDAFLAPHLHTPSP